MLKDYEAGVAVLDKNDPNWERSFALKHNLNASLACYC
jgi:hypothetical protein